MQKFSKVLTALAVLAIVVAVGVGLGLWATRGPEEAVVLPEDIDISTESPTRPGPGLPAQPDPPTIAERPTLPVPAPTVDTAPPQAAPTAAPTWEDKLDEILGAESDDTNKVAELLVMFPTLSQEAKVEVAQHLSNLVEDENYAPLGNLLQDTQNSEEVLDVLMADLLDRPDSMKLPLLLEIARNPGHPHAGEAKDILELYIDEDYGNNWAQWDAGIKKYLAENPDE